MKQSIEGQGDLMEVLKENGCPMSAYGIINVLKLAEAMPAPQTVYRTLFGLTDAGTAHKHGSVKAFPPCLSDHGPYTGARRLRQLRIGGIRRSPGMEHLSRITGAGGFRARRHVVMQGLCET